MEMAGENEGAKNENENGGAGGKEDGGKKEEFGFKPVTFSTQEEYNQAFAERAARAAESAKGEILKDFEEAGATPEEALALFKEHKEAEEAKKTPDAKAAERAAQVERELQAYKNKEAQEKLAEKVSKEVKIGETPIPPSLLRGNTADEMKAFGQSLVSFIETLQDTGVRQPGWNQHQGGSAQDKTQSGDWLREAFFGSSL